MVSRDPADHLPSSLRAYTSARPRIMAVTTGSPPDSAVAEDADAGAGDPRKVWHRMTRWLTREDEKSPSRSSPTTASSSAAATPPASNGQPAKPGLGRRISRRVVPSLPRPPTFKRQNSERRDRLEKVATATEERRALSVDRRKLWKGRPRSVPPQSLPRLSAPAVCSHDADDKEPPPDPDPDHVTLSEVPPEPPSTITDSDLTSLRSPLSPWATDPVPSTVESLPVDIPTSPASYSPPPQMQRPMPPLSPPPEPAPPLDADVDEPDIRREHEERWILNLSMHFRDRSPREKFFITYAETPYRWRRITVSVDYRNAPPDSLERDLQGLPYQRDKSYRIYEAIRPSLPDIQWYDTVTNLRLETSFDDRLHVHVTEDTNEIISYPSVRLLDHIDIPRIPERDVQFDSHMSGFVYKVRVQDKILIKKEIPGPDSVEEFLYEINALYSLVGASNVVQFEGIVVDDDHGLVKGVLIAFAEQGPLVDMIYDFRGHLEWERRQKWCCQIVSGLSQIHEAGFVQGDFTLSNIVIDENDTAVIIDINRRGCPVGWEPPEIARMIQSGQRISMYIGVKSDLYQLGMVLWGLVSEEDEPERQDKPLPVDQLTAPQYIKDIITMCLSNNPRDRKSAKELFAMFPEVDKGDLGAVSMLRLEQPELHANSILGGHFGDRSSVMGHSERRSRSRSRSLRSMSRFSSRSRGFSDSRTYFDGQPYSTDTGTDGPSYIVPQRGRSPPVNTAHLRSKSYERPRPSEDQDQDQDQEEVDPQILSVSPSHENKWEEIFDPDGNSFLVETEENSEERLRRIQRSKDRMQLQSLNEAIKQSLPHVDSGLGDMDGVLRTPTDLTFRHVPTGFSLGRSSTGLSTASTRYGGLNLNSPMSFHHAVHTDSGLADMDLAGVGENEVLKNFSDKELELDLGCVAEPSSDLVTVAEDEVVEDFDSQPSQTANPSTPAVDVPAVPAADKHLAAEIPSDLPTDGDIIRQKLAEPAHHSAGDGIT